MEAPVRKRQRNGVLAALSNEDYARLEPHLEPVPLKFRERLQSENRLIRHVYFVESGLASVVAITEIEGPLAITRSFSLGPIDGNPGVVRSTVHRFFDRSRSNRSRGV